MAGHVGQATYRYAKRLMASSHQHGICLARAVDAWLPVKHQEIASMILPLHNHCDHCCRINNAGSNGYKYGVLGDYTDAELVNIVETNVLGVMLGCREVLHKGRDPSICTGDANPLLS